MSNVTVKIPTPLRPITGGQSEVKIEGATVGDVLRKMDVQFKGFGERVLDDGQNVKRFINVFVNEDNIRDKKDLDTEVKNGDTISILPSIAGGVNASIEAVIDRLYRRLFVAKKSFSNRRSVCHSRPWKYGAARLSARATQNSHHEG